MSMDESDEFNAGSEALSQAEVERLLAQVAEEQTTTVIHKPAGQKDKADPEAVQPFDFRQPAYLSASEMRKLRLRHEEFIRSLAARLSIYLRLEFSLQISKLQTLHYQKFVEALPNATHLTLFKAEPLRGICLLEIPPRLGLTIVDRLLGGPAHSVNLGRDLSEIEMALLDQAVDVILGEWCNHWTSIQDLRPVLLGHENNGRFLQTSPHDTVMLVLAMEARIGDCLEQIQIAFPYYTLDPLIRQIITSLSEDQNETRSHHNSGPVIWNRRLDDVRVPLTAEWSEIEVTARALTRLKVGDTIEFGFDCADRVEVKLAGIEKFRGRLGTRDGCWAVQLTEAVQNLFH